MKRSFLLMCLASAVFALPSSAQTGLKGDMNGDGRLTVDDVTLLVEAVMEFEETEADSELPYVDLGLTSGTLWAKCNLGAEKPEEAGFYFSWGETTKKNRHYEGNYTFNDNSQHTLSSANDAAYAALGSGWRMPTEAEMQELINECIWEWSTLGAVKGYTIKSSKNGASIFLPAAGVSETLLDGVNYHGFYWTNAVDETNFYNAKCLDFTPNRKNISSEKRYKGASIRPVREATAAK